LCSRNSSRVASGSDDSEAGGADEGLDMAHREEVEALALKRNGAQGKEAAAAAAAAEGRGAMGRKGECNL
jgi:hypothetical protein